MDAVATPPSNRVFWRSVLAVSVAAMLVAFYQLGAPGMAANRFATSWKWKVSGGLGLLLLAGVLALMAYTWRPAWAGLAARFERAGRALRRLGWLNLLPLAAPCALVILLVFMPLPDLFEERNLLVNPWARLAFIWLAGTLAAPFMKGLFPALDAPRALLGSVLLVGAAYQVYTFVPQVNSFPFTLGWSEASRFYYGSLFFSGQVYGVNLPWPFLHPSRYLLLSLPYLVPGLPLIAHRLWQALLWLGLTALSAGLLARRLKMGARGSTWVFAGWAFLFIFQGPVYYHLLVPTSIVLAWFDSRRFTRSLLVVAAASLWAGISRINWFPVPALLGIVIYLLETRFAEAKGWWKYLRAPLGWGAAGGAAALAAQAVYIVLSRQPDARSFGSSFFSDLLWYRLFPSPTYPPGILWMAVLVSAPLLVLVLANLGAKKLHPLRLVGLAVITLLLFGGGLVVSVKIGGGSNLHNLDSFLLVLLLWGSYLWSGRFAAEEPGALAWAPWPLVALAALLPLYPLVLQGGPVTFYDYSRAAYEVNVLKGELQPVLQRGGRVLFIWQRQLETFQMVGAVPLVPDYETVDLMEMAMSDNHPYLERFYSDLRQGRYDLIVTMKQGVTYQGPDEAFPEENNVWVRQVQAPLMTYYEEVRSLDYSRTLILKPKPSSAQGCPQPAPTPAGKGAAANPADQPMQPTLQGQAVPICPAKAP